ncbi:DUF4136 domain-containing protein [Microbulbifer bruguierae]|uniref:DUF4136 domain-containing protein n=1 Tax=Microbulbifer bruguierae TaxID=3029061 RepID=A0ABY8NB23_9GAMM|nr:DUF4136 domain-containing protein [Microbulbifer bruguierae]WGL16003.1 DUF4136 domain-containing protein [Microbulbifer bruguierae]
MASLLKSITVAALGLILALGLGGCVNTASRVAVDYDPNFKFANLRSYYLLDTLASGPVSPLESKRASQAVDDILKGSYQPAASAEEADFLVRVQLFSSDKVAVYQDPFSIYGGYRYFGFGWRAPLRVREYRESSLIVDVLSPENAPLWRGSVPSTAGRFDAPEQQLFRLREEAALILGRFPPYNDVGYD